MPIINNSNYPVGQVTHRNRYNVKQAMVVSGLTHTSVKESLKVVGPLDKTTARDSLTVKLLDIYGIARESADINEFSRYEGAILSMTISGRKKSAFKPSITIGSVRKYPVRAELDAGLRTKTRTARSADISGGDSFLILCDILSASLSSGITDSDAENNIQILNRGSATTWAIWLNYGGYVLLTSNLTNTSTASNVKSALVALTNVPNSDCVIVTGSVGGPFTVEFTDAMGHRFISPMLIETAGSGAGVSVTSAGSSVGSFNDTRVNAYVRINDVELAVKSFDYQEPAGKLGALLNVTLAFPDPALVPINSSVDFGLTLDGVEFPLIENGKLSSRNYSMRFRQDEVTFGTIDVVADKFTLAPRRPVIMFDPTKVLFNKVEQNPRDAILNSLGQKILPVYEPVAGLTMTKVLGRAYTNSGGYGLMTTIDDLLRESGIFSLLNDGSTDQRGLGFSNVITNIKDYPIKQANFSIDGGWHSGAQGAVGMYNPDYIPLGNLLMILSSYYALPVGQVPRVIPLSLPTAFNQTVPFKNDINAVLLTYQISASEDPDEDLFLILETDPPEVDTSGGPVGDIGHTQTTTTTSYLRKKRFSTLEVVAQVIDSIIVERRVELSFGNRLVSRDTTHNIYSNDLKTGHHRTVESLSAVAKAVGLIGDAFPTVQTEDCEIFWIDDPTHPGQKVQARNFTRITGLVYTRTDVSSIDGTDYSQQHPIMLAQESGVLLIDYEADALGEMSTVMIETVEEKFQHVQGNQYETIVVRTDCLNGGIKQNIIAPRTGDTSQNPYDTRSHTKLLRDTTSEAEIGPRIPASLNAGELPPRRAFELGNLFLGQIKKPLQQFDMTLAKVDIGVVRGTVIIGQTRYSYTTPHITLGRGIKGENLGVKGHSIIMTLEARELPTVVAI